MAHRTGKKTGSNAGSRPAPGRSAPGNPAITWISAGVLAAAVSVAGWFIATREKSGPKPYVSRPSGELTFSRHIAPIVYEHCAPCHRPSQAGPFELLTFADVARRAKQIVEVTQAGYMPPWLPAPGHGEFAGERRLSTEQLGMIRQWVAEGAVEGDPSDLPALPQWPEGWQLGAPDLVIEMPEPFMLPADGRDVYRNFVIALPMSERRYVKGIEFRPNTRAIHHAFLRFDRTSASRRFDERTPEPGFDGMHTPASAQSPEGHFATWQPGKAPSVDDRLPWLLEKGTDLVLQMHMQPTGKVEPVRSTVGFHFTDNIPAQPAFKIELSSYAIDIPPGVRDYLVEDQYRLPVDVEVLAVAPHAHYLGRKLQAFATLPDGRKEWLLLIKDWDFNWQGDYRYRTPLKLPKGTLLTMQYTYDNSSENPRNPNDPPQPVKYGIQSTDEMAELWLQLALKTPAESEALAQDYLKKMLKDVVAYNHYLLRLNPENAKAYAELGKVMITEGRHAEAMEHLRRSVALDPTDDEPQYHLGLVHDERQQIAPARQAYEAAIRLNPENYKARNNLGLLLYEQGELTAAEQHFLEVLRIRPGDSLARENLDLIRQARLRGAGR